MSISLIASIGKNGELGQNGDLVWRSKADLKYFRETTTGHPILMGSRTFASLPKLLPGRQHLVVTREARPEFFEKHHLAEDTPVKLIHDLGEVLEDYHAEEEEDELFIVGGGTIYRQTISQCDKLYLTEIDKSFPGADTFFPEFDKAKYTREVVGSGEDNGTKYEFVIYTLKERL
ncbi:dihydrofolate reductase [Candidatus Saccharibacteria bacterium]|nr:dihydrofolate reductase [Candidatus Saccharibacteria bacterium]